MEVFSSENYSYQSVSLLGGVDFMDQLMPLGCIENQVLELPDNFILANYYG